MVVTIMAITCSLFLCAYCEKLLAIWFLYSYCEHMRNSHLESKHANYAVPDP